MKTASLSLLPRAALLTLCGFLSHCGVVVAQVSDGAVAFSVKKAAPATGYSTVNVGPAPAPGVFGLASGGAVSLFGLGAGLSVVDGALVVSGGTEGAPTNATYITQTANGSLSNEQALSALATGLVKNTTSTGVLSIAVAGTDYEVPLTFSTGLTRSTNTITINTTQNIAKLSNLTSNGVVTTTSGDGTLAVVTASGLLDTISSTRGAVLIRGASGWTVVTPGTSGHVLTSNGAGADPSYQAGGGGGAVATDTIWDAKGDLVVGTGANTAVRLAAGTNGYYLMANSSATNGVEWAPAGDMLKDVYDNEQTGYISGRPSVGKVGGILNMDSHEASGAEGLSGDGGNISTYSGKGAVDGGPMVDETAVGGNGGVIDLHGADASADITGAYEGGAGGSLLMYGQVASGAAGLAGGSISTYSGGGSINTRSEGAGQQGMIQLGSVGSRTTIYGDAAADWTLTLPTGNGAAGQVLTTDGDGVTSWEDAGAGDALTSGTLAQFASTTSSQMRGVISDEVGTGAAVFESGRPTFANVLISHSTLTYGGTTDIDMDGNGFQTVTLTGNITFTTSNRAAGKSKTIRIVGDSSGRTLSFPSWVFVGGAAPTSLAASKTAILTITAFGTADTDIIAAYAVEP